MLTRKEFSERLRSAPLILDGATGSNLRKAGMPKDCCAEEWILQNSSVLTKLQTGYAEAGSDIIYAPTFQAQPAALARFGLENKAEEINASLVALSRKAAPGCLIAGDIATMAAVCDSWDPDCFDLLVDNYRRQICGLIDGGADLLIGETLMYPQEAEAILTAAELEQAESVMISFTMQSDGSLFSGMDAGPVLKSLEDTGVSALGFNCVTADGMTAGLVSKLRRYTRLPLLCKPNAGNPVINMQGIAEYSMTPEQFTDIISECLNAGASLAGGCCGTDPEYIRQICCRIKG